MLQISNIIEQGDLASLVSLVAEDKSIIGKPFDDSTPDQPLHYTVWQNQKEMTLFLIEQGADINARGDMGLTPLHYAAIHGRLELAKILLEHGANPNIRTDYNHTPLLSAARTRDHDGPEVARFLLESGAEADLNSLVSLGKTERVCALLAQDKGNLSRAVDAVSLLDDAVIMVGWEIVVRKQYEQSPEKDAIVKEYEPMFECLLEAGADINAVASTGVTPLYTAVNMNIPALVRFLVGKGADVNFELHDGTDLIYICQGTRKQEMRQIIEEFKNRQAT